MSERSVWDDFRDLAEGRLAPDAAASLRARIDADPALAADFDAFSEIHAFTSPAPVPGSSVTGDTVSEAMGEEFEAGTISCVHDDTASRRIDPFECDTGPRSRQCCMLGTAHDVEDSSHGVSWLAEHERASQVRLISFDATPVVHHDDGALTHNLRLR